MHEKEKRRWHMDTNGPGGFLVSDKGKIASSCALHNRSSGG